jgi:putative transposase
MAKQFSFFKTDWQFHYSHGGVLRQKRKGRKARALSCREPLHVVFKINSSRLRHKSFRSLRGYSLTQRLVRRYAKMFFVKVEQISIQHDHLHLLIRTSHRSLFHHFFRVVAGQIAQQFAKEGLLRNTGKVAQAAASVTGTSSASRNAVKKDGKSIQSPSKETPVWKHRPFSRVVRGYKAYLIVRNYIQLNEKEVTGEIRYSSLRLKGLSSADWSILWS